MRYVIDSRYVCDRPSGIGSYVEALVTRLPALAPGESFRLWTHPERPRPIEADNVSHHCIARSPDGLATMFVPSRLDTLESGDVVHFPNSLLGRGVRQASVVTIHDLMWLETPSLVDGRPLVRRARQPFYQSAMRRALERATHIITVSKATADRVLALAPDALDRLTVTYNAVSPDFSPPADEDASRRRAAAILGTDAPYFVVVGKNEPYKAHHVAVRAFAAAARPDERLVLVQREFVGRGLSRLVDKLRLGRRVVWIPKLSQPELIEVLRSARALLQPSLVEGFGIPVLEAIACGCPVVASDTPALVEVLEGAGLYATAGAAEDMARAIRRLRDGQLRAELRGRGLERARVFDWNDTARATLDVYREARRRGPLLR